jgi:hypothetical protein
MSDIKEIKLVLDLENERDHNIFKAIKDFGKKHNIDDDSEALKSFIVFIHFIGSDMKSLGNKIKDLY